MAPRRATAAQRMAESAAASLRETRGLVDHGVERAVALALDMAKLSGDGAVIEQIQDTLCQLITVDKHLNSFLSAVNDAKQQHEQATSDPVEDLSKLLAARMETTDSTFEPRQDQRFLNFQRHITDIQQQVEGNGAEGEMQEDVVFSQAQQTLTCPLTTVLMRRPMRNKKCQHSYEESAIMEFIHKQRQKKRPIKCPVVGCDNVDIHKEDLEFDPVLFCKIESRRREETSS
ncbi:E3 SUMO-protein ligase NSE2 [Petromyzon marinus]|uniref:E3 SUMO-protein ligase NSE2 n=1 Tax=Petromyzon marinus TaxID=7757 RepID=A0AAJ7WYR6_PETMA|nr:E3 SUMO-protein ligase NSE2 isoform X2 [Petromyzon marinus]